MTAHTPGPWIAGPSRQSGRDSGLYDRPIYAQHESAFDLATVHDGGLERQLHANAALIAAAPDLLAALENALRNEGQDACLAKFLAEKRSLKQCGCWRCQARRAIAKAVAGGTFQAPAASEDAVAMHGADVRSP